MRIVTGGISHETSTFAPTKTTLRDFETGLGLFRGEEIFERFRHSNNCTGGFIEGAAHHGCKLVPLLWTFAYPGGLVARADYEALKAEFIERLHKARDRGPVEGVLLDLHGAMVIEEIDDGDGDFIGAVRQVVGKDCPIVATFDLHGNHTQRRLDAASAVIGFDTYPHVDMAERGREAADLIVRIVRQEIRPVSAMRALPLFWSAARQVTAHPPIDEAFRLVHEIERRPGILSVTLATGFPWADVPHMGASMIVVADGDQQLAQETADELGNWLWERRADYHVRPLSVSEALAAGEQAGRYPILLADMADNTGGGAPGDSTEILRTFVERDLQDALLLYLVDADIAQQAHVKGIGQRFQASLGAKSHERQGTPVTLEVDIIALSDGQFTYDGPMYAGLTGDLGPSAWLRHRGVNVVVVSGRMQPLDQAFARGMGIDCRKMRYIALKSAVHFRSGFEQLAGSIHNVNAQAIHTHDFVQLPYQRRRRPMFPLEM
ncbi:MAG: M81 family metallopeptidase [Gemmataceae bacterium]